MVDEAKGKPVLIFSEKRIRAYVRDTLTQIAAMDSNDREYELCTKGTVPQLTNPDMWPNPVPKLCDMDEELSRGYDVKFKDV